jgi:hypothetical protein
MCVRAAQLIRPQKLLGQKSTLLLTRSSNIEGIFMFEKISSLGLTVTFLALLTSCSSTPPPIYIDPLLNSENSASLHFYRPGLSAWMGMAIDYRVVVEDI